MIRRIYGLFIILLTSHFFGYSQKAHFQHITSKDGLSQSEVYSFLEDSRGFMWFGTLDGLNRYDGYNVTTFNIEKNNPNSISNNTIRSLSEDHLGRVWIGTDDGLCVYDPQTEKIHQIRIPIVQNSRLTIHSIEVSGNNLLIGTSAGLLRGLVNTRDLQQIGLNIQQIRYSDEKEQRIILVKKSENGKIWISNGNSLLSLVLQENTNQAILIDEISALSLDGIRNFTIDKHQNLWICTYNSGLFRYQVDEKVLDQFHPNDPKSTITTSRTSAITSDINGNIWIGTIDKGLLFLNADQLKDANPKFDIIKSNPFDTRSLNSNLIFSMYYSKSNLLWIGTIGSGINIFDPTQKEFNHYTIPPTLYSSESGSNFIRSVYADEQNHIWIGTHNNGLYLFDRLQNRFRKLGFETESVFYIYALDNDRLLICTSDGVSIVKLKNDGQLEIQSTPIKQASFFAQESKKGTLWLATIDGLYRCNLNDSGLQINSRFDTKSKPSLSYNNCRVLHYSDKHKELYLGTEGGGLNILPLNDNHEVITNAVYQKDSSAESISNNYIRTIIEDANHNIWLGTYEGLNKLIRNKSQKGVSFKSYSQKDGLPNNMVQLLEEGGDGNLWIGTNDGLCKFNPEGEQFVSYSITDGVQSNEFSEHAVYKRPNGEIIVGGINGFNTFYPDKIQINNNKPTTTITSFYLFNNTVKIRDSENQRSPLHKSITVTDSLFLQPNQTNLGFEFSALIHSNPEKVQYAYKLEGLDQNWNYTNANNRRANYTNLEFGTYNFKVKSTNNDGKWEDLNTNLYIHIKTPFIFTWVAYVIYVLVFILVTIYFTNYSVMKYTTKEKILLENEHNQQLHQLDELRTRFFINISHDLRTPLTLISEPLKVILKDKGLKAEIRNRLNLAHRNVQKLRYITEQLLDISKAEAGKLTFKPKKGDFITFIRFESTHFTDAVKSKGLVLNMHTEYHSIICNFDSDMISKIFFNLLSNAIKYTKEGEIIVRIGQVSKLSLEKLKDSIYSDYILLEIQDSGKGIDQEDIEKVFDRFYQGSVKDVKGYGIGLSHCKDLVEAHAGHIEASSEPDHGTTFRVFIPKIDAITDLTSEDVIQTNAPKLFNEDIHDVDNYKDQQEASNQKKILIIEDDSDMRNFISDELNHHFNVIVAQDGLEGLELVEKHAPELIISDIMMPHMDGIEFCRRIKSDLETSHIPMILLTAKGDSNTRYESIETGADDYIPKPFEIEYLILRIKNLLKSKDQIRQAFQSTSDLKPLSVAVTSLDKKFISELMAAMEEGIPDPEFTVNTLEFKMGMSHTNFYRKIKSLTGKSGKEILMDMRMKRAKQILTDGEGIRISEVAYSVGFSNPKYFSKCFKEYYGVLPSDL